MTSIFNVLVRADRETALNVLVRADREDRDFDRGPPVRGFKEISITFSDPAVVALSTHYTMLLPVYKNC